VLYAAGHEPTKQSTTTPSPSRTARANRSCPPTAQSSGRLSKPLPPPPPQQTVVQGRTPTSPNS
jgi:hypothetical protein